MPIKLILDGERVCARVFCDECHRQIEHAENGNYGAIWPDGETELQPIFFTHKKCHRAFEARWTIGTIFAVFPLSVLPVYLAANLGMNDKAWNKAKQDAAFLGSL